MAAPMAVLLAADAIEKFVAVAVQQLANEASLVFNFRKDFQWVTRELTFTKAYLKDAHQKSTQNDFVKQWLRQLHDVALDGEDIVDECAAESLHHHNANNSCALNCSQLIFKRKIGKRIRDLKARMSSIVADATRLYLFRELASTEQASTSSLGAEQWKRSSLLESNTQPIAIEAKVDEILRLFDDDVHHVIGVVGMGGVGKTFLLQNVYNDSRTKGQFEKCIWLSVSQRISLRKLQSDMASSLDLRDVVAGHLSEQRAAELIRGNLHEKKFLIVLDDVWRATNQDNLIERLGVPSANTGSKIVVTTRDISVCRVMNASSIYHMEVLKEEESWKLFCAYAFPDHPENRPPQYLKELAGQVENKCGKLPLALKIVGASMAFQTLVEQWESKLQKLKAIRGLQDPIQEILQLSYDSLPADLKPCFLYFAFFGEDEVIRFEYLIKLWKAEGFIPEGDEGNKIGLNYFYQLSNLCLVEAWEDRYLCRYCKIHDLLLDLAIYICKENEWGFTLEEGCKKYSNSCTHLSAPVKNSGCRRIFLPKQGIANDDISDRMLLFPAFLRTLSLIKNYKITDIPASLFSKVRALRVLDLSNTSISTLPSSIGCLKLLKALNLSDTKIKELPDCIRSLKNLRTLYMFKQGEIERVPEWVSELKCLENLVVFAKYMPKTISELLSLRVLDMYQAKLSVEENGLLRLEDVGNLIRLRELRIKIHWEAELQRMEEGVLEHLVNMRRLTVLNEIVTMEDTDNLPVFSEKFISMTHLEYLWLQRFVVPSSLVCEFVNLRVLGLRNCDCTSYPGVESLPNLISLILWGNKKFREVRELFGKCGAFSTLRFLEISNFPVLEEFTVLQRGSMPCLEEFMLSGCKRVGRVEGLDYLRSLKAFYFCFSGTDECRERLKEGGEEWNKIKINNPRVQIYI